MKWNWLRRLDKRKNEPTVDPETEIQRAQHELDLANAMLQKSRLDEATARSLADRLRVANRKNHLAAALRVSLLEGFRE